MNELEEALRIAREQVTGLELTLRERAATLARHQAHSAQLARSLAAARKTLGSGALEASEVRTLALAPDPLRESKRQLAKDELTIGAWLMLLAASSLAFSWIAVAPRFFLLTCVALVVGLNYLWDGAWQLAASLEESMRSREAE
jgi:hypothetical protein